MVNHATNLPALVTVVATNMQPFTLAEPSLRPVALERTWDDLGIEAGWFPTSQAYYEFTVELRFRDEARHRVSFYVMDFDTPARIQRIDVLGPDGVLLDSREVSLFTEGKYLTWNVRGPILARFKSVRGVSTVSGIFIDPDLTPFQLWLGLHFTDVEQTSAVVSGPGADPDGDGLDNRTEYALGLNPRSQDILSRPSLKVVDGYLTFTYTRAKAATDVMLFVEWSGDLVQWKNANLVFETLSSVDGGPVERVILRSMTPSTLDSVGFLRTRVANLGSP